MIEEACLMSRSQFWPSFRGLSFPSPRLASSPRAGKEVAFVQPWSLSVFVTNLLGPVFLPMYSCPSPGHATSNVLTVSSASSAAAENVFSSGKIYMRGPFVPRVKVSVLEKSVPSDKGGWGHGRN